VCFGDLFKDRLQRSTRVSNDGSEWSISLGNDSMFSMNIEDWLQVGEEVRVELKF
jgi:hypothetical protein